MECIFCRIIKGELPSLVLEETEDFLCFLPINMECFGHTLIVPKVHYSDVATSPPEIGQGVFHCAQLLARKFDSKFGRSGFNLLNANGVSAEQSVPHLHFHFLPRCAEDGLSAWPHLPGFDADRSEFWRQYKSL